MSKVAGDFEHLADEIRLGDLQSLGKDLKLLHTGKGALDMDAKTSDVGAVLALLLGEVLLPIPALGWMQKLTRFLIKKVLENEPPVCKADVPFLHQVKKPADFGELDVVDTAAISLAHKVKPAAGLDAGEKFCSVVVLILAPGISRSHAIRRRLEEELGGVEDAAGALVAEYLLILLGTKQLHLLHCAVVFKFGFKPIMEVEDGPHEVSRACSICYSEVQVGECLIASRAQ